MRGFGVARVVLVVLAAVGVLAVIAAGTYWLVRSDPDEQPTALPTTSPTSDETGSTQRPSSPTPGTGGPSPTDEEPTPPPFPAEASAETEEGAIAFVEWWFAELNYAQQTGDTRNLEEHSGTECETCSNLIDQTIEAYSDGGSIVGGDVTVSVASARLANDAGFVLDIEIGAPEAVFFSPTGEATRTLAADSDLALRAVVTTLEGVATMSQLGSPEDE